MSVERVLRDRLGGHIGAAVAMNTAEAQYFDTNIDLKDSTLPINIYFLRNSCIFRIIDLRYDHPVGLSKLKTRSTDIFVEFRPDVRRITGSCDNKYKQRKRLKFN